MTYSQSNMQSTLEKVGNLKARYLVYAAIALIPLASLISADKTIFLGVEDGSLDINSLHNINMIFLHNSHEAYIAGLVVLGLIITLIGFAIFIRIAQSKTHDDIRDYM